jgi:hypothetical protein
MEVYLSLSRYDIENQLSGGQLLISRVISLALTAAPLFILLVIFLFYLNNESTGIDYENSEFISILIYALAFIAIGAYGAFLFIPQFFLKPEYLRKRLSGEMRDQRKRRIEDPILKLLFLERTLMIIRLALLESISFLGMVILFLCVANGYVYYHSLLWLLVLPWLFQAIYTFQNYVPKEKYLDRIENDFLVPLRSYSE